MLILMRHGQASFGDVNYDRLSLLGTEQARVTGAFMHSRGTCCDDVRVGPRERHRETAAALTDAWGSASPPRCEDALDEFAEGAHLYATSMPSGLAPAAAHGEHTTKDKLHRLMSRIGAWADGELVLEGCPTLTEFRARIGRWLRHEVTEGAPSAVKMAVTSGGVIAAAVCEVMDLPNAKFLPLVSQVRNASLTEISVSRGRPVIVSFNGTHHLPARLVTSI